MALKPAPSAKVRFDEQPFAWTIVHRRYTMHRPELVASMSTHVCIHTMKAELA
ncbi:MAG: hypothetical protein RIF45_08235 [Hyphomicrobiales bacterium]|jgi:hypothetical protein